MSCKKDEKQDDQVSIDLNKSMLYKKRSLEQMGLLAEAIKENERLGKYVRTVGSSKAESGRD